MLVKLGVELFNCVELVKYIEEKCLNLYFLGFMIIGNFDYIFIFENFKVLNYLYIKMFFVFVGFLLKLFMIISLCIYEFKVFFYVILIYFCEYLFRII